jgi:Domain of Unknown Function (DUF326)
MPYQEYQRCIDACNACAAACENCASECLHEKDVQKMARCIELDRDCADLCALPSRLMSRGSDFAVKLCALCAEICDACAAECAKYEQQHCKDCAEACRKCADECRRMAR